MKRMLADQVVPAVAVSTAIAVTILATLQALRWDQAVVDRDLERITKDRAAATHLRIDKALDRIAVVQQFHDASNLVEPEELRVFLAGTCQEVPELRSLTWVHAPASGRPADVPLTLLDGERRWVPEEAKASLHRIDKGLTDGIPQFADAETDFPPLPPTMRWAVMRVTVANGETERRASGWLCAAVDLEAALRAELNSRWAAEGDLQLALCEGADRDCHILAQPLHQETNASPAVAIGVASQLGSHTVPFHSGGTKWSVHALPSIAFRAKRSSWTPWFILLVGGGGACLLGWTFVTKHRRAQWMQQSNERLQTEIELRRRTETAALNARDEARAATAARTQFLANVSHEIRTPMAGILGFAELMFEESGDLVPEPRIREAASLIKANGEHLMTVIQDILDMSQIEAGQMEIEHRPVELKALIERGLAAARTNAVAKGLTLETHVEAGTPSHITTDPKRLAQILDNCLSNAVKFTEQGGILVTLLRGEDDQHVAIRIRDTGIGMDVDQLEQVRRFELFSQGDGSMSRRFDGVGLGLSISNSLTQMLGGSLDIDSWEGRGTEVTVSIAVGESGATKVGGDDSEAAGGNALPPLLEGMDILVVEDAPLNQRLIKLHLEQAGASVEIARNGKVALDRLHARPARSPFDLVLMDMQMPELDGYAATRVIRQERMTLPVIALTALASPDDRERCLAAGCNDFMSKPFEPIELVAVCDKWSSCRT